MDCLAHIGQRDVSNQFNFAGVTIDLDFCSTPGDLPKSSGRAQGSLFTLDILVSPASNDFTGLRCEGLMHQAFEGNALSLRTFDSSMVERQSIGSRLEYFSAMPQQLTFQILGSPLD